MGCASARNLGGNLFKDVADARNESSDHRNLDGINTDGLGLPVGKKSLGEIFFKMLLRKK